MSKEFEILLYLADISAYVKSALNYFENEKNQDFDKEEMIVYLSTIPEIVENIKQLFIEIELENEKKIVELEQRCC